MLGYAIVFLALYWVVLIGRHLRILMSIAFARNAVHFWPGRLYWIFFRRNDRYERLAMEVRARAAECGLPPVPFCVWTIRRWVRPYGWRAEAWIPTGLVVIHTARGPYSDAAIKVILAHEYGHLVDFFWGRQGHPLFTRFQHLDLEDFADTVAAYLWGSDVVVQVLKRHHLRCREGLRQLEFTRPVRIRQ